MVHGLREPQTPTASLPIMSSHRKRSKRRRFATAYCDILGPDDGVNPRDEKRVHARPVRNRKALQLCRQVVETLALVFAGCADPVLNDLLVVEVRPAPDSSRMLVLVHSATEPGLPTSQVREHLERACGMLRREVARSIHRRKTPELTFDVLAH